MRIVNLDGTLINVESILYVVPVDDDYEIVFSSGLTGHNKGVFSDKSTYAESPALRISERDYKRLVNKLDDLGYII